MRRGWKWNLPSPLQITAAVNKMTTLLTECMECVTNMAFIWDCVDMISMLYASKDLQTGNHIQCMDVSSQCIAHTTVSRNYISEMLLITWCLREMCKLTIRLPSRRGQIGTYVELRLFRKHDGRGGRIVRYSQQGFVSTPKIPRTAEIRDVTRPN